MFFSFFFFQKNREKNIQKFISHKKYYIRFVIAHSISYKSGHTPTKMDFYLFFFQFFLFSKKNCVKKYLASHLQ